MKCDFGLRVLYRDQNGRNQHAGCVNKTYELPFPPEVGLQVECIAWKEPKKVQSRTLSIDPDTNEAVLSVGFGQEIAESADWAVSILHSYELHGWTCTDRSRSLPVENGMASVR